jgi:hypothetical protein
MSVQDGLAVADFIGKPPNDYAKPPFKLCDASSGVDNLCPAGLPVTELSFRYSVRCDFVVIGRTYSAASSSSYKGETFTLAEHPYYPC